MPEVECHPPYSVSQMILQQASFATPLDSNSIYCILEQCSRTPVAIERLQIGWVGTNMKLTELTLPERLRSSHLLQMVNPSRRCATGCSTIVSQQMTVSL